MVFVSIKKLDDVKKLEVGKELPIPEYTDSDLGLLEVKGWGYVYKNKKTRDWNNKIYNVSLHISDIEIYEGTQKGEEGYAQIDVHVIDKDKEGVVLGSGSLMCIFEETLGGKK